jgi:hypothetical protein
LNNDVSRSGPWLFPYHEEPRTNGAHFLDKPFLRPAVWAQFVNMGGHKTPRQKALVDSGCDHILAPDWLATMIGVVPDPNREMRVRLAGATRTIQFADVTVRLCPPGPTDLEPGLGPPLVEWETEVGFWLNWSDPTWLIILGQCGFFDQFTIAMSRHSQALAVLPQEHFDEHFDSPVQHSGPKVVPRFSP